MATATQDDARQPPKATAPIERTAAGAGRLQTMIEDVAAAKHSGMTLIR